MSSESTTKPSVKQKALMTIAVASALFRKHVKKTLIVLAIILGSGYWYLSAVGVQTTTPDPVRYDVGFFRRWSINSDNDRYIVSTKRLGHPTEAVKVAAGAAYKLDADEDGHIWRTAPNNRR